MINKTSECYAIVKTNNVFAQVIEIYHPLDIYQLLYYLTNIHTKSLLYFNGELAIYTASKYLMLYEDIISALLLSFMFYINVIYTVMCYHYYYE